MRLVLAISIDGRLAEQSGGEAKIGGEGDRSVLEESLAWADGMLVGAGTMRAHKNICLIKKPELIQNRLSRGKTKQPIAIIVSNKILSSPEWPLFNQPIQRWMLTKEENHHQNLYKKEYDRIIYLKESWDKTLSSLYKYGISKIALLGGAILVSSLIKEDQIDELQLTISPKVLGGKYTWLPYDHYNLPIDLTTGKAWSLNNVKKLIKNEVMLSYYRNR